MGADSDPPRLDGECFSSPRRVPLPYVVLPNAPHFLIRSRVDRLWGVFNTPLQQVQLLNEVHFGTLRDGWPQNEVHFGTLSDG